MSQPSPIHILEEGDIETAKGVGNSSNKIGTSVVLVGMIIFIILSFYAMFSSGKGTKPSRRWFTEGNLETEVDRLEKRFDKTEKGIEKRLYSRGLNF